MRAIQTPPTQLQRMDALKASPVIQSMFPDSNMMETAIRAILSEDPLTHYVMGLESWQDYLQARSKHWPVRGI